MAMAPSVSSSITVRLEVAMECAADAVSPDEIGPHYIIPSVFHPDVTSSAAIAVADVATQNPDRFPGRGRPES